MKDILNRVHEKWRALGIARPGVTAVEVEVFEGIAKTQLPAAMVNLLEMSDGTTTYGDHEIRFWPVAEVSSVSEHLPNAVGTASDHLYVFADYSIWAHAYAIRLPDGPVYLVGGPAPIEVAPSFEEFLRSYLDHPKRLFGRSA